MCTQLYNKVGTYILKSYVHQILRVIRYAWFEIANHKLAKLMTQHIYNTYASVNIRM